MFLIILIFILLWHFNKVVQSGGAYGEGLPCDQEHACRSGLICFGRDNKGVCQYPKTNDFGLE